MYMETTNQTLIVAAYFMSTAFRSFMNAIKFNINLAVDYPYFYDDP